MFLGQRIVVWKEPGRKCSPQSCDHDAFYRVTTLCARLGRPSEQTRFLCPTHALRWAEDRQIQLPKVK